MSNKDALIQKQKEYIEFLGKHISDQASFLHVHGQTISSEEYLKGVKFREEIAALESPSAVPDEVRGEVPEWFEKWAWEEVGRTKLTGRSDKAIFVNAAIAAYKKLSGSLGGVGNDTVGWISVGERLPEKGSRVLTWNVATQRGEINYRMKHSGQWFDHHVNVTHWQSLPAPPSDPK